MWIWNLGERSRAQIQSIELNEDPQELVRWMEKRGEDWGTSISITF